MQRRNVDLPEPDGPEQAHHLARRTSRSIPLQHLVAPEALVDALGLDHRRRSRVPPLTGSPPAVAAAAEHAAR